MYGNRAYDIFALRRDARELDLANRVIPALPGGPIPVCVNEGCGNFILSDTGTQCIECRTAPRIIAVTRGLTPPEVIE